MRRILVTGSRGYSDKRAVRAALPTGGDVLVIHGGAVGADLLAAEVAQERGLAQKVYYPNWKRHGKAAGPIRNSDMLEDAQPTEALAFWDGKSRGTKDMIDRLNRAGVPLQLFIDKNAAQ